MLLLLQTLSQLRGAQLFGLEFQIHFVSHYLVGTKLIVFVLQSSTIICHADFQRVLQFYDSVALSVSVGDEWHEVLDFVEV